VTAFTRVFDISHDDLLEFLKPEAFLSLRDSGGSTLETNRNLPSRISVESSMVERREIESQVSIGSVLR
jgi:hypothetical protein